MEFNSFVVHTDDKKDFETRIKPEIAEGNLINVFCSFTYITPNYSILFTLEGLKKFIGNNNCKVLIVLWDMNTIANEYFRKLRPNKKTASTESFINQKVKELKAIALSLGFDEEKLYIYKSSDLWKRLISYKEEDLFQQFYSTLAQMRTHHYPVTGDKISHLIQIPMDMFFCNYFHNLYPEDLDKEVDIAYFGQNKEELYKATRELMIKEGLIESKNPIFVLMKNFPYLVNDGKVPEWNMNLKDVKNNILGANLSKSDIFDMFRHLNEHTKRILLVKDSKKEEVSYSAFYNLHKNSSLEKLINILADNLYIYLQEKKKIYSKWSGEVEESILNISDRKDARNIGSVLKSTIALEIILRADGTRNTTKISKELSKSIATISTYVNRLKRLGLVRILPDGNIRRTIKGVKINLELGV